ncbi:MAG: hypothetical protein L0387_20700 [Acidobacteria bacterium]|nr:hypothetical protein [Acidobacteriota bacterium]
MIRETFARTILLVAGYCTVALAQAPPPTILEIDVENQVEYDSDIADPAKFATIPNTTTAQPPRNFDFASGIADIVAVNGQAAKGTVAFRAWAFLMRPAPIPGGAIADITRTSIRNIMVEIQQSDGTPVGTIMAVGMGGGSPPPGAPLAVTNLNFAIVGGTGAYLGARGQLGLARNQETINGRLASISEDPGNRRLNGGGRFRYVLHLMPMPLPQIVATPTGPAVVHSSDFTPVTASKPAAVGETLSVFATGLGPVRPGVEPGQPFRSSPLAVVNSPVEVKVNGKSAEVLAAVGFPGAVDGYQVNFRVPPDTARGIATIQVSAAWIAGAPVSVPVQ